MPIHVRSRLCFGRSRFVCGLTAHMGDGSVEPRFPSQQAVQPNAVNCPRFAGKEMGKRRALSPTVYSPWVMSPKTRGHVVTD